MTKQLFFSLATFLLFFSCKNSISKNKEAPGKKDSTLTKKDTLPNSFDVMDELTAQFENKVQLDTFINYITKQQNVRLVGPLYQQWNDETKKYTYNGYNYTFGLKIDTNQGTTFKDGNTIIRFGDNRLTCDTDTLFECEDYGFNINNTLDDPKIIEIAGHRFLYSDVSYWCNGIGCGCNITFIYDPQTRRPTFLENYRVRYDGFFISDFDNDKNPDLLVISKHRGKETQKNGLRFDEFDIKLSWYYYDKGKFKPRKNKATGKPYSLELFSFVPDYNHSSHGDLVNSVSKNNWVRY